MPPRGRNLYAMRFPLRLAICALLLAPAVAAPSAVRAEINLLQYDKLIEATLANDAATVESLLDKGRSPDVVDDKKRTPLILAAVHGYADIADLLVRHKAKVNAEDEFGNSAMFYAAVHDDVDVLDVLIEGHGDVNSKNRQGVTPLMGAAGAGSAGAVEKLLEAHAKAEDTDYTGRTARDYAVASNRRAVLNILDRHGVKQ